MQLSALYHSISLTNSWDCGIPPSHPLCTEDFSKPSYVIQDLIFLGYLFGALWSGCSWILELWYWSLTLSTNYQPCLCLLPFNVTTCSHSQLCRYFSCLATGGWSACIYCWSKADNVCFNRSTEFLTGDAGEMREKGKEKHVDKRHWHWMMCSGAGFNSFSWVQQTTGPLGRWGCLVLCSFCMRLFLCWWFQCQGLIGN